MKSRFINELSTRFTFHAKSFLLVLGLVIGLLLPTHVADAGIVDRLKDFYYLPENVEKMKQQYDETKKQYEETRQELADQKEKLAESTRLALETEKRLKAQNQQLIQQNEMLQKRLLVIEKAANSKAALVRQIKYTGLSAAALIILYFLSGRLIRLAVWRRQKIKNQ